MSSERFVEGTWKFPYWGYNKNALSGKIFVTGPNAKHFKIEAGCPWVKFVKSTGPGVQEVVTEATKKICTWSDMVKDEVAFDVGYYFTMESSQSKSPRPNLRWMSVDWGDVSALSEYIGMKVARHLFEIGERPRQASTQESVKFIDWSDLVVIQVDDALLTPIDDGKSDVLLWKRNPVETKGIVHFKPSQRRIMRYHKEIKQAFRELAPFGLPPEPGEEAVKVSSGWLGLRQMFYDLCIRKGIPERDAHLVSWNLVPPESRMRRTDLLFCMVEAAIIPEMLIVTFNERIRTRTRQLSNSDIGRVVEEFTHSSLHGRGDWYLGSSSGKGHCDISSWKSCRVNDIAGMNGDDPDSFYALNVKFSSEPHVNRIYEVTPENEVVRAGGLAWVLLVISKSLRMVLFPLDGSETQHLNSNKGTNTSPETLAADLDRLIEEGRA